MRPVDFISLARRIFKSQDEASWRAATSLAYYGAFHFVGERLELLTQSSPDPFLWTGVPKSHQGLRAQWAIRWAAVGSTVAELLFHAHELRKKADYDLHLPFTPVDKDEAFQFVAQTLMAARRAG